jgi:hypothetical protein
MAWSRVLLLLLVLWLSSVVPDSHAQAPCQAEGKAWRPVDYQEFTVTNLTPVGIDTAQLPAPGTTDIAMAYISIEEATIRFRFSGLPSDTSGHEVAAGTSTILCGRRIIASFRAIRTSSGSSNAIMRVTLFDTHY